MPCTGGDRACRVEFGLSFFGDYDLGLVVLWEFWTTIRRLRIMLTKFEGLRFEDLSEFFDFLEFVETRMMWIG